MNNISKKIYPYIGPEEWLRRRLSDDEVVIINSQTDISELADIIRFDLSNIKSILLFIEVKKIDLGSSLLKKKVEFFLKKIKRIKKIARLGFLVPPCIFFYPDARHLIEGGIFFIQKESVYYKRVHAVTGDFSLDRYGSIVKKCRNCLYFKRKACSGVFETLMEGK